MMPANSWTAVDIAAQVRTGALSAREATADALSRILARDVAIDAFQTVRELAALQEADVIDARADKHSLPMAGVPVAIKDNVPVTGESMSNGTRAGDLSPQASDHPIVQRLRSAGAVVVGLTRTPELCVFGATDSVWGITRNPWNLALTPGGSSGGSAAAVAAGMVPVAHGNDGMGSIRIPAACCGLVGIKPGLGRVPAQLGATDWYGMSENGVLSTTVADAALMLSVLASDHSLAAVDEVDGLRIAVSTKSPVQGVSVDREWLMAAFMSAAALMRDGHTVERREMKYPTTAALGALSRWFAGAAADADTHDQQLLERRVVTHAAIGRRVRTTPLMTESWRESWRATAGAFLEEFDVLLTPALARPPIEAQAWSDTSWVATMAANVAYAPFAAPWNFAGFPAITVPAGVHATSGTPLAVQLVAAPGRESLLLSVAAQLERARPWMTTAPNYG